MPRFILTIALISGSLVSPALAGEETLPPWLRIGPQNTTIPHDDDSGSPTSSGQSVSVTSPDGNSTASASISGGQGAVSVSATNGSATSQASVHGSAGGPSGGGVSVSASGSSSAHAGSLK